MLACHKEEERIIVNETSVIKKLSANNFYTDFLGYSIRSRAPGTYQIETDSILEFEVDFDKDDGVSFTANGEPFLDERLKSIYSNQYLKIKETYLKNLNKLIPFMVLNGIEAVVNISPRRIDFYFINGNVAKRFHNISLNIGVESSKKYYDSVTVIDSNWVILKNEKLP